METARTRELAKQDLAHLLHPQTTLNEHAQSGPVAIITEGHGVYVKDSNGKEYIDGLAELWNVNVGHGRAEIAEAVSEQMKRLAFATTFFGLSHDRAIELSEKMAEIAPPGINRFMYTSGGSESNETAFKIARYFWRLNGKENKYKIIARRLGYHGVSYGALSATGIDIFSKNYGPLVPGFLHVPPPYCYRCELGATYPDCGIACAKALDEAIVKEGPDTVAAFIAEPVQGAGGVIVPPPEYLPMVREICAKHDVLFIADEVITGFGRTGKMFAVLHWDVKPDMIAMAKGITSGYVPLGAVGMTSRIYEGIIGADSMFAHGFTYSGHPVCCAASLANISIIEREGLVANSAEMGNLLLEGLQSLADHPHVGEVRGLGLLAGVEIVEEKNARRPFDPSQKAVTGVANRLREKGVMCRAIREMIIAFSPPLCINADEVNTITSKLKEAIEETL